MKNHEIRKVLTLCGDRGWHDPDDGNYDPRSMDRGFRSMNEEINNLLATRVTIHSVSYTPVLLPAPGPVKQVRIYATVVYSGTLDVISVFGKKDPDTDRPYTEDSTLFYVYL